MSASQPNANAGWLTAGAAGAALGWVHDWGRAAVKNQMASEEARDRNSQGRGGATAWAARGSAAEDSHGEEGQDEHVWGGAGGRCVGRRMGEHAGFVLDDSCFSRHDRPQARACLVGVLPTDVQLGHSKTVHSLRKLTSLV